MRKGWGRGPASVCIGAAASAQQQGLYPCGSKGHCETQGWGRTSGQFGHYKLVGHRERRLCLLLEELETACQPRTGLHWTHCCPGACAPAVDAGTVVSQALSSEAWRHLPGGWASSRRPTHIEQLSVWSLGARERTPDDLRRGSLQDVLA